MILEESADGVATSSMAFKVSIEEHYCAHLFDELYENPNLTEACVEYCVNYISNVGGDCCDVSCGN
jgi:hypothetical protein